MTAREQQFKTTVHQWWRTSHRDLPWRRTQNPYRILVSEIMLQQTQVDRVIPRYRAFLKRFPTVHALAKAPRADIIRAWSGLGYNRRAVNLHRTAQLIVSDYGGQVPMALEELKKLSGVGDYTAKAVLAFAHNAPVAPVDTNIRRILIRHFGIAEKNVGKFAKRLLPNNKSAQWNHMLMDYGALVCTSRNSTCEKLRLAHIAQAPNPKPQEKFAGSDRFWRGRIVAALRTSQRTVPFPLLHNAVRQDTGIRLSTKRFQMLVLKLERDGLLRQKSDRQLDLA